MKSITFKQVLDKVKTYISNEKDIEEIKRAYAYAYNKHDQQLRKSGEPYINHPLWTTYYLATWHMDLATLISGLLHDVLEDTPTTFEDLNKEFDIEISTLVEAVTKVSYFAKMNRSEIKSNYLRKLYLSMAHDIRVIVIKLADRLHNIQTIEYLELEKQKVIAKETLEVYSSIAHRLGMRQVKSLLEDLSFAILNPVEYKRISRNVDLEKEHLESLMAVMMNNIKSLLSSKNIKATISGRSKSIYSIYRKMYYFGRKFEDIHDLLAIRIITNTIDECYTILGYLHQQFPPLPGRFKDYIATPKYNLYQSLHTTVIQDSIIYEIQIRTVDMDEKATYGAASHWKYKEGEIYNTKKRQADIDERLDIFNRILDLENINNEELESNEKSNMELAVKSDIFTSLIYVLTPNGKVITLPFGSTILDFAYKVHTDIGEKTTGGKINGNYVSISTVLKSGDVVEIKTSKNMRPSRDWLVIAKTSYALHKIKRFLKKQEQEFDETHKDNESKNLKKIKNIKKAIDDALTQRKLKWKLVSQKELMHRLKQLKYHTLEDFYLDVANKKYQLDDAINLLLASNETSPNTYLNHLQEKKVEKINLKDDIIVKGADNIKATLAHCCMPVPLEPITGYVSKLGGIRVHRVKCHNILPEERQGRLLEVWWNENIVKRDQYYSNIKVICYDRDGLMANITHILANLNASIQQIHIETSSDNKYSINLVIKIANKVLLQQLLSSLQQIPHVYDVIVMEN
ncbi:RelA/SpoT family protein [Spiroplasma endosymbiont of Asaphidion curtum]|uniref:RelA/SpoT family protein n=1 Tax=Spiroplasma endosymbiont of Asaphidion curtum TaxID=3066281 RepID=UPI00313DC9C5